MKNLLLALVLLVPGLAAVAQEEEGEVIVISELSRPEVRQFIEEAEDQFYAIFNANVDDDDFKVTCSRQTPTGTNIPVRVCEPEFMLRARADNQNTFQFNRGAELSNDALRASLQPEYDRLQAKMEEMTREIPEFAQIASILTQLRARLAELSR
ncbi:MAG: hypothetical protein RL839_08540 [Gammaproteobacteria bacterium]